MNIEFAGEVEEIKREPTEIKQKKERKPAQTCPLKTSSFFITINTNYHTGDKSEEDYKVYKKKFTGVLAEFLPDLWKFVDFKTSKQGLKFGYSEGDSVEVLMKKDRIIENSCKYVLEISPDTKRLHAHILFFMKKRGVDTKLNMPKIKEYINNAMGGSCYINYKLVPAVCTLEDYMKKNPIN